MNAYFPRPRRDELLYGVLARLSRHMGLEGLQASRLAFGDRTAVALADIPTKLGMLWRRLPEGFVDSPRALVDGLTLLPYHVAFRSPDEARAIRRSMASAGAGLHLRLGLAASKVPRPSILRFCPSCHAEVVLDDGEGLWRRAHQLPGVSFCPAHRISLRYSTVDLARRCRHAWAVADDVACPTDAAPIHGDVPTAAIAHLVGIAESAASLLEAGRPPRWDPSATVYRERLAALGLMRSPGKADQRSLRTAVEDFYGDGLALFPGAVSSDGHCGDWLEAIVRPTRNAVQPVFHLLLRRFLDAGGEGRSAVVVQALLPRSPRAVSVDKVAATRVPRSPRRDWATIDAEAVGRLADARLAIMAIEPPRRVTIAELERAVGRPNGLRRRRVLLPRAWAEAGRLTEPLEAYRKRRISGVARALREAGSGVKPWQVMREAGLAPIHQSMVEEVLHEGARTAGRFGSAPVES